MMPRPEDVSQTIDKFKEWLQEDGFSLQQVEDNNSSLNFKFQKPNDDLSYNLVYPNPGADFVIIGLGLPGQDFSKGLAKSSPNEGRDFLTELKLGLLQLGVEFNGVGYNTDNITLFLPAYFDGITKDRFMDKYRRVKNASYFLRWKFSHTFGTNDESKRTAGADYIA